MQTHADECDIDRDDFGRREKSARKLRAEVLPGRFYALFVLGSFPGMFRKGSFPPNCSRIHAKFLELAFFMRLVAGDVWTTKPQASRFRQFFPIVKNAGLN